MRFQHCDEWDYLPIQTEEQRAPVRRAIARLQDMLDRGLPFAMAEQDDDGRLVIAFSLNRVGGQP